MIQEPVSYNPPVGVCKLGLPDRGMTTLIHYCVRRHRPFDNAVRL